MLNKITGPLAALVAVAGLAGCDAGPEITPAAFTAQPNAQAMADAYPSFARLARIPGKVKLRCEYSMQGKLQNCDTLAVAPEGLQFEGASRQVLGDYVVKPQMMDGRPAPAPMEFVIAFDPPPPPAASVGPGMQPYDNAYLRGVIAGRSAVTVDGTERRKAVDALVQRALLPERRFDILVTTMVMGMTKHDREMMGEQLSPYKGPATGADLAVYEAMAERIRTEYCASNPCDATLPAAAAAN
jgi:hypothetical protein